MKLPLRNLVPTILACLSLAAVNAVGQQPQPLKLNRVQTLQVENDAKDVKLAEQQIELLKVQLAAALLGEQRSAQAFNAYLTKLHSDLNVPAGWVFDPNLLSFVPRNYKPPQTTAVSAPSPATAQATATALKTPTPAPAKKAQ